ncbi:MAG: DUF2284 domain-containing protein [Promethearchaeota archaeon]
MESSNKMFWFKKKVRKVQLKCSRIICTYDEGKACRYPELMRISMEASGIDVNATVKNIKINLEWPPITKSYRFSLVCLK